MLTLILLEFNVFETFLKELLSGDTIVQRAFLVLELARMSSITFEELLMTESAFLLFVTFERSS